MTPPAGPRRPSTALARAERRGVGRGREGEQELLERVARFWSGGKLPDGAIGIGDDAALLPWASRSPLLISTDLFVEGIHFDLRHTPSRFVGSKALAVAASDIGAMGGIPVACLLSLALPARAPRRLIEALLASFGAEAREIGIPLLGGDLSRSQGKVFLDVVVLGRLAGRRPIRRDGARPGDGIYVTGALGGAAAGLTRLQAGARRARSLGRSPLGPGGPRARVREASPPGGSRSLEALAIQAHLRPRPPLAAGAAFGRSGAPTAMMDLSDGLAIDLRRMCRASGVGAEVWQEALPIHPGAIHYLGVPRALAAALGGGEDYELLLAAPRREENRLGRLARRAGSELVRIGTITHQKGEVLLIGVGGVRGPMPRLGYDHFGAAR